MQYCIAINMSKIATKCSVYIAMSLDGFIAKKDGSVDWLHRAGKKAEAFPNDFIQVFYEIDYN